MFLRSLSIKGFKSFADATSLGFEPGVTAVVGPNGSGKSNVVDAIAWVLGAQAPSLVRSTRMDDVIFAGTAKRAALGRAEVALTIDNADGILPIEFSEVTVSRTLWRSGDSEYAINGVPCRLLDVQELLSDSGVGRQQHVIVSQGQIDAVLDARPEDRRSIIEEAAGVLKYRKRKEKAERRLDATEGNLLRVQDLLREVRRQLRPLERQAEAARRHGEIQGELTTLRIHLAGRELMSLRARQHGLHDQRSAASSDETGLRRRLAALDTEVITAEGRLASTGAADVADALVRVERLRERAHGLLAVLSEQRRGLERDRVQLLDADVTASLEAEAAQLRSELDEVARLHGALAPLVAELDDAEAALAAERTGAEAKGSDGATEPSATRTAAEVRGELKALRAAHQRDEGELARLARRRTDLEARAVALGHDVERGRDDCEQLDRAERSLVEALEQAEAHRLEAEATLEVAAAARLDADADATAWRARVEALGLALDEARARAGTEHLDGLDGVLGPLLELVEVDEGWAAAFEAAAGEALAAVVVADASAARRALARLHDTDTAGGVLSLPLSATALATPPDGEPVRRHVRGRQAGVDALLDRLLGSAVAVTGWAPALDVALAHPGAVVVTPEGDRFGATWRVGTAGAGVTGAALDEARVRLGQVESSLEARRVAEQGARSDLDGARVVEAAAARRLDDHDSRFSASADALGRAMADQHDVTLALETVRREHDEVHDRLSRQASRLHELDHLLADLDAEEAAEVEAARHRDAVRVRFEERAADLATRRRDVEVRLAGLDERQALLTRRLGEAEERLARDAATRERAADDRHRLARATQGVERLASAVAERAEVVEAEYERLTAARRRFSDEMLAASTRLDELRHERAEAERHLEAVRERLRRVEIDEAEVRLRLETAVEAVRRDLDTEPDVAIAAPAPELPEGVSAPARGRELERELRLLGPINPLALEEFHALEERHTFLQEQLDDVKATRRELLRVIRAIDDEIQTVFAAAYADVSEHFTALFSTLFPGGEGRLVLTNPDDLLSTGIEVEAKPSGKNVKKLSLLSGGERSLTALAFLFAVFRSRPSPFYVLDEVEAALDDVNLHRFLELVREFRDEAQLIVVTHQKRTMEAADSLLGVSMQPGGSSKVVTERLRSDASASASLN